MSARKTALAVGSLFALSVIGCNNPSAPPNGTTSTTTTTTTTTTPAPPLAPTAAATPVASVATATPVTPTAPTGPQRIQFTTGANWGTANMTLGAGKSQQFVVGAKEGQSMDVEVSSEDTTVNLIRGKADTTGDSGYLNAELKSNGDYIFEVRNPTKQTISTSVKVTIEDEDN